MTIKFTAIIAFSLLSSGVILQATAGAADGGIGQASAPRISHYS